MNASTSRCCHIHLEDECQHLEDECHYLEDEPSVPRMNASMWEMNASTWKMHASSNNMMSKTRKFNFRKLVAFDFDNTITQDIVGHDIHDKSYLDIMGGQDRLDRLKTLFENLERASVQIIIVSFNVHDYVRHFLERVGLYRYVAHVFDRFFIHKILKNIMPNQHELWGSHKKQYFMRNFVSVFCDTPGKQCLLVDDQQSNLVSLNDFCGTLKIYTTKDNTAFGIQECDITQIYKFFGIVGGVSMGTTPRLLPHTSMSRPQLRLDSLCEQNKFAMCRRGGLSI